MNAPPPICERCGKRHPLPWPHEDEQLCSNCRQPKAKRDFRDHVSVICKPCAKQISERMAQAPLEDADSIFARIARNNGLRRTQ